MGTTRCPVRLVYEVLVDAEAIRSRGGSGGAIKAYEVVSEHTISWDPGEAASLGATGAAKVAIAHELRELPWPLSMRDPVFLNANQYFSDGSFVLTSHSTTHPMFPATANPVRMERSHNMRLQVNQKDADA